jgi:hypothetical protein
MDDMTKAKEADAGIGHNHLLEIAQRAVQAMRDYETGVAKEQAGRDISIAAIIDYGRALAEGHALHTSNNAFGDWVKAQKLDAVSPFHLRQERAAAGQMAKIAVDSMGAVNAFSGCPHSRPTHIMAWWRAKQPKPVAPAPQPTVTSPQPAPKTAAPADTIRSAPASTSTASKPAGDRVQAAADRAEIVSLRKENERLRAENVNLNMRLEGEIRTLAILRKNLIESEAKLKAGNAALKERSVAFDKMFEGRAGATLNEAMTAEFDRLAEERADLKRQRKAASEERVQLIEDQSLLSEARSTPWAEIEAKIKELRAERAATRVERNKTIMKLGELRHVRDASQGALSPEAFKVIRRGLHPDCSNEAWRNEASARFNALEAHIVARPRR